MKRSCRQLRVAELKHTNFALGQSISLEEGNDTMPISTKLTELATKPLPKAISPGMHAAIDWGTAGTFVVAGTLLWKKNKRAALASFLSGNLIGSLIFLTDCPGGVWKKISFETHGRVDAGVSALVASLPNLLGFSDERESKLFQGMGIGLAAVRSLTNFDEGSSNQETRWPAA